MSVASRAPLPRPLGGLALVTALLLGLPVVALVGRALFDGALAETLGLPIVLDALSLSLGTTSVSLLLMVALGTPLAYVLARGRFRGRVLLETVVDATRDALRADVSSLYLLDRDGANLTLAATNGLDRYQIGRARVPVGEDFWGRL